jgi:hypothetical protein
MSAFRKKLQEIWILTIIVKTTCVQNFCQINFGENFKQNWPFVMSAFRKKIFTKYLNFVKQILTKNVLKKDLILIIKLQHLPHQA